jgi:hypothetical protein
MSTHVIGFKPPNAKFTKMLAAYRACEEAGIGMPVEVEDFFGGEPPDSRGVIVPLSVKTGVTAWSDGDMRQGYEVDLQKLPKDVTVLRFYNSF